MNVNLDDIINKITGWNLQVTVDGKTINIAPPSNALIALATGLKEAGVVPQDVVPQMKAAVKSVVDEADHAAVDAMSNHHLLGTIVAIYEHAKATLGKNLGSVAAGVKAAMQGQNPATAAQPWANTPPAIAAAQAQAATAKTSASGGSSAGSSIASASPAVK